MLKLNSVWDFDGSTNNPVFIRKIQLLKHTGVHLLIQNTCPEMNHRYCSLQDFVSRTIQSYSSMPVYFRSDLECALVHAKHKVDFWTHYRKFLKSSYLAVSSLLPVLLRVSSDGLKGCKMAFLFELRLFTWTAWTLVLIWWNTFSAKM